MLQLKNLSLKKNQPILKEISLEFHLGKTTALLGKSGSGKTSLLRCIAGLESYEGEISCSQPVGFVPQQFSLFPHMTALQNCMAPLIHVAGMDKSEAEAAALKQLAALEMEGSSYPHELSGGQRQRVAIARALLLNPRFLLLDEPSSALDPKSKGLLIQILRRLKGRGLIIATHDMDLAKGIADELIFIENGAVAERSPIESVPRGSKLEEFLMA